MYMYNVSYWGIPILSNNNNYEHHLLHYMKIHVPSMLAKGVETIKKQTQQASSHNGLENS